MFGDQMPQGLWREDERVEEELLEVLARPSLERDAALLWKHPATIVRPCRVRPEIAAPVCRADLEHREAIERALEDEVRQRERGFQRVPDHVSERATPLDTRQNGGGALRMGEDRDGKLLGLRPEGIE